MGFSAKEASSNIEMSGHGLEEGSREGKVAVLDEDGEVSKSERLRLKAMLSVMAFDDLATSPKIWKALVYT